jgi:RecA-family ATPase
MSEHRRNSALGQRLNIEHLLKNPAPAIDYVLPGLPAGTVGLLVGPGGMGKTMLELQLAVLLSAGLAGRDPLLGLDQAALGFDEPRKVVMVAAEEPLEVLWTRLHAIVRSLELRDVLPDGVTWNDFLERLKNHLSLFSLAGTKRLTLLSTELEPTEAVEELIRTAEGARLVIVDPLRQLHLADENASGPMSAVMSVFKRVASQTGAAVLVAHHSSRASSTQGYGDTADASRGSTALKDDARWQVNLMPASRDLLKKFGVSGADDGQYVSLADAKGNYAARRAPVLLKRTAGGVLIPVLPQGLEERGVTKRRRSSTGCQP